LILAYYATVSLLIVLTAPRNALTPFFIFANAFAFIYIATVAICANLLVTRCLLPLDAPMFYTIAALIGARRVPQRPEPTIYRGIALHRKNRSDMGRLAHHISRIDILPAGML
jgi:hypothetical protein